jgi:hypothetical protein
MSDFYHHKKESVKKISSDYYAGYYWGNHPYESNELAGHVDDEDLKSLIV